MKRFTSQIMPSLGVITVTIDGIIDWVVIIIVDSSSARHESPWADSD
jgi:hypothetical protein